MHSLWGMTTKSSFNYSQALRDRIRLLMDISGFEISGFADYTGISESHLYAILNGTREITNDIIDKIVEQYNIKPIQLLNLDYSITEKVIKKQLLNNFYSENKGVIDYFQKTRIDRKAAYFVEHHLLNTDLFNKPVYVWEIRNACIAEGKKFDSKRISQILNYLVERKKLKQKKKIIKLKSGKFGRRVVNVYYKLDKT